jgi:hypothetical protein
VNFVVGNCGGVVVDVESGFLGEFRIFLRLIKGIMVIFQGIILAGGFLDIGVHLNPSERTFVLITGHHSIDSSDIVLNGNTLLSPVFGQVHIIWSIR